jgi:hypothetical protein
MAKSQKMMLKAFALIGGVLLFFGLYKHNIWAA